jgi:hypothetical protein
MMISFKLSRVLPCASFFTEGRILAGVVALLMQLSLVFWPAAARWARATDEQSGMEKRLAELSEAHRTQIDPYSTPTKKFRQPA